MTTVRPYIRLCLIGLLILSVSTPPPHLAEAGDSKLQLALLPLTVAQAVGGMTATLDISGVQGLIPMAINLDGTVTATVPNIPVGEHTLTITYRSPRNVILAIATGEAVIQPDVNTRVALNVLNTSMDDDNDGATNLEEVISGTNPNDPISGGSQATLRVNLAGNGNGAVKSLGLSGITCGEKCENSFIVGAEIRLIVEPELDSMFSGWQGTDCGRNPECLVTFQENLTVVATFVLLEAGETPEFTLSVTKGGDGTGEVIADPSEIRCGENCTAFYDAGTTVILTAIPDPDSMFSGWSSGECIGTGTCQVTMATNQIVTATFVQENPMPQFTLSVTSGGNGTGEVTTNPRGVLNCGEFLDDDAFPLFPTEPGEGQDAFPPCGPATTPGLPCDPGTGPFPPLLNAARKAQSPGPQTIGTDCSKLYDAGTTVTLTAIPDPDSMFAGWNGGGCVGTGTCQVTMATNQIVTATFVQENPVPQFTLTVQRTGDGRGALDVNPDTEVQCQGFPSEVFGEDEDDRINEPPPNIEGACSGNYAAGTTVTLTAIPDSTSIFAGWFGSCGGDGQCTVTMNENKTVLVMFSCISDPCSLEGEPFPSDPSLPGPPPNPQPSFPSDPSLPGPPPNPQPSFPSESFAPRL